MTRTQSARPPAATIAIAAIMASIALITIGYIQLVLFEVERESSSTWIAATAMLGAISAALSLVALLALWRGKRWAPTAVIIGAAWAHLYLYYPGGWLVPASAVAALVAIVAAWLPSARAYGGQLQEIRGNGLR